MGLKSGRMTTRVSSLIESSSRLTPIVHWPFWPTQAPFSMPFWVRSTTRVTTPSLHTDATLLPTARRARASWNFLLPSCVGATDQALVSYDMNRLQGIPSSRPHVVTLNGTDRIRPGTGLGTHDL